MRPDPRLRRPAVLTLAAALLATSAATTASAAGAAPPASSSGTAALAASSGVDPARFPHPLATDARYFPLRPGTQFRYDGTIVDDEGRHPHQVVFTVTDLVKRVDGITVRVVLDEDIVDGVLSEAELAFFAQDRAANVWTLGEYPEEYEHGRFAGAPSTWISGQRHARGGILVPGTPVAGSARFVQGRAPRIDFYDVGRVVGTGLRTCVETGCYRDVAQVEETAPDEPNDGRQLKDYAPGVGLVKVSARGGDSREDLRLVSSTPLTPAALSRVRSTALRLERRAYRISEDYRSTTPAHR